MFRALKSLLLLVIILGGAAAAYLYFVAPERVYCHRTLSLCDMTLKGADETCIESISGIAKSTPDVARSAAVCAVQSQSCLEVMGCLPKAGFERLNKLLPNLGQPKGELDRLIDQTDELIEETKKRAKKLMGE